MYILKRALLLAGISGFIVACSPSQPDEPAAVSPPVEDAAAPQDAKGEGSEAADVVPARWSALAALEVRAIAAGYEVHEEGAGDPEVAVPRGTEVTARVLSRGGERAELYVFRYPAAGYAGAHARGVGPNVAAMQDAEVLVAVYAADQSRAQAVLAALIPNED